MMKKGKIFLVFLTITSLVASLFANTVSALEITITENGSGSSSEVASDISSETVVQQSNNSQVTNNVGVNADTGGNSVSGSSGEANITTGDISSNVLIANSANFSE